MKKLENWMVYTAADGEQINALRETRLLECSAARVKKCLPPLSEEERAMALPCVILCQATAYCPTMPGLFPDLPERG